LSEVQGDGKMKFFNSVDVISVPVRKHDGYGLYILESNDAGIPMVQPATGAFPEILEITKGGIIYSPDNVDELVLALTKMLENKKLSRDIGNQGKSGVSSKLSLEIMASGLSAVYNI
jgi:glycosyltransferase involved in cell wall biosynthesis